MCRVFRVHQRGFYEWLIYPQSNRTKDDLRFVERIRAVHVDQTGIDCPREEAIEVDDHDAIDI